MFSFTISTELTRAAITIAHIDAEIILADVINVQRAFLIAHNDAPVSLWHVWQFRTRVKKRAKHYPLAYITGKKEFYGYTFHVNEQTLIPRPETELIVAAVIKEHAQIAGPITLFDIGTGSGCIPIAIRTHIADPLLTVYASDISKKAIDQATINATRHTVDIHFSKGNLLEPIKAILETTDTAIITANLPYLTQEQFDHESTIQYEPRTALVAEHNGLAYYEQLLLQLSQTTLPSYLSCYMEIDPDQTREIKRIIQQYFPTATLTLLSDLAGMERIVHMHLTKK